MCGSIISSLLGIKNPEPPKQPRPVAPTPPPVAKQTVTTPTDLPKPPDPGVLKKDDKNKKAEVTSKKIDKKARSKGTTQLATKKPATGGLRGVTTGTGVNTGAGGGGGGTTTTGGGTQQ